MIAKITSGAVRGVDGYTVSVEVDISQGMPSFEIVGLPDSAVKESRERVKTAIKNSGIQFPIRRIVVNLAPADTKKEGPSFDLPISVGILVCIGVIRPERVAGVFFSGELSLDGSIRPVSGVLPMVNSAFKSGTREFVLPLENSIEGALTDGARVASVKNLREMIGHLTDSPIPPVNVDKEALMGGLLRYELDFADVKGQSNVKRAMEIAASGKHNILMIGPPGSGKTMMAKRLPTIMPPLTLDESIEITKIYSVANLLSDGGSLVTHRPFRSPHHTVSFAALTGGGSIPKPGEISLAHNGILFLDELPEFHKNVIEVLRQPMEDKNIKLSRVNGIVTYPSDFLLVASMNPCPCGYYGDSNRCKCSLNEIDKYLSKISGPLLDRVDLHVEASTIKYDELGTGRSDESSEAMRKRVLMAREIQLDRYRREPFKYNSDLTGAKVEKYCRLGQQETVLIKQAFDAMNLSMRAYHKILKTARTIADISGSAEIRIDHLAEAIQYRNLDRKYW